ncbi:sugar transferase [Cognatishimia activa]|uniref:sugar transferase n=1 Tax=Cognatishimia activa TaxID=1715691 RepID=UPI00223047B1|nr:sugar transferase [Cognatishimia activa]UZD91699.1 sugar transferase [Cognatishimia activa]
MAYFERRNYAPVQLADSPAPGLYRAFAKRIFDLLIVALLAIPTLIVVVVTAVMVAMDGKSPFYTQKRVGRGGREFSIIKLRSMVQDADALLTEYLSKNPEAREEWDEKQKLRHDPRITKVGHFIRKTSLDELPQLWNVMMGDMSLVGPRPMLPCQQEIYPGRACYNMRPGITGLWQVSERNEASFKQRAFYDNQYHEELSFGADLAVMAKTVTVVLRANGH